MSSAGRRPLRRDGRRRTTMLEPWYEHLYATLHADAARASWSRPPTCRGRARSTPAAGPAFSRRSSTDLGWTTHGIDLSAGCSRSPAEAPAARGPRAGDVESLPYRRRRLRRRGLLRQHDLLRRRSRPRARRDRDACCGPGGRLLSTASSVPASTWRGRWPAAVARRSARLRRQRAGRVWRAVFARDGVRLPYPGYGLLRLFRRRELGAATRRRRAEAGPRVGAARRHQPAAVHRAARGPATTRARRRLPGALPARRRAHHHAAGAGLRQQPRPAGDPLLAERVDLDLRGPALHPHRGQLLSRSSPLRRARVASLTRMSGRSPW